jgi:hypothetical protein
MGLTDRMFVVWIWLEHKHFNEVMIGAGLKRKVPNTRCRDFST